MNKSVSNSFFSKVRKIITQNFFIYICFFLIASFSVSVLYSAGEGWNPWALKHTIRFIFFIFFMTTIGLINIRRWYELSYKIYTISFVLLFMVELFGLIGMGAQRWLDLYFFHLQPSEFMKVGLALALARYYSENKEETANRHNIPIVLVLSPAFLILRQPDLGTAIILIAIGVTFIFLSGISTRKILVSLASFFLSLPLMWSLLHDYQKARVLNFLNPEREIFGAGYHVFQSKIALGSGGLFGKGFLKGTQIRLNFLPEKHTDFAFTTLCEEFGFIGGSILIITYMTLLFWCLRISFNVKSTFGKFLGFGVTALLFFHIFINIAMVMGLLPVVGVPLPILSYGGSALLVSTICLGLVMSVHTAKNVRI